MDKKTILIIEDEDVCRQLVELVIDKDRFTVVVATNGEEGLKKIASKRPDLVFLDIMLPKINGYEIVKTLKADPALAAIPIVVISARAGEDGKRLVREAGCQDFLPKPFKVAQIKQAIERFIA